MQFLNRTSVAMLLCSSLLVACTKETVRVEEKLIPPAKIEASASIQKNTVSFAKSSLGKLFLLMPVQTKASRAAAPEYMRSMVVSFERNGSRVAVYNRSTTNSQTDIIVDPLIQTFEVVSETDENITFDIGQGFISLNMQAGLDVVMPDTYSLQNQMLENKSELVLKLKDSYVKSLALKNNSIQLVQDVRMIVPFKPYMELDPKVQKNVEQIAPIPKEIEQGATLAIEIKPYVSNESFEIRKYDSQERFGFFINKVGKGSSETQEPLGQIARWDIAESRGPIRMLVAANFPQHLREGVTHSADYWNKIFGREVLKVEFDSAMESIQPDRTIVVRWIQWDEGNGAYANIQTDPLTGESLRAIVYITSAFTAEKNYVDGRPKSGDVMGLSLRGLCDLAFDGPSIHKVHVVGEVMAHEVGHVLGLRHNFAGTANAPASDQEIKEAVDKISLDGTALPVAASSTVMDYPPPQVYSILGAYTKSKSLPYDKAAIEWGYFGKETPRTPNMYCSDEHIMSVSMAEREFLGCERRDLYSNVFFAERAKVLSGAKNLVANMAHAVKYNFASLKKDDFKFAEYYFSFNPSLDIATHLYESNPQKVQPLVIVDDVVPAYLQNLSPYYYRGLNFTDTNSPGDRKITADLAVFGGMKAYLETLNPVKAFGEGFFQNQVKDPNTIKLLVAAGLTEEQALRVQAAWMIRAKLLDENGAAEAVTKLVDFTKLRRAEWKN